ncbi:MAG: hypothetical protein WBL40_08680 [Terrimicrobiaceae bacterium]
MIARAAISTAQLPYEHTNPLVIDRVAAGKRAWWLSNRNSPSPSPWLGAGKALVRLALDDRAYQQVWHPPTCSTGRELIDICAQATGRTSRHITLTRPMIKLIGLFLR